MNLQIYHGKIARLLVQPDDGVETVVELIRSAEHSIRLKMFELEAEPLVSAMIHAKTRGVRVEILLNQVRSSGLRPNDAAMARLKEAGIDAAWASRHFAITHEKSMVIDDSRVLIATFNFSDKYFDKTRDYGVVVKDPEIIGEVIRCFETDKAGSVFAPSPKTPLAWGNITTRRSVADIIDSAEKNLAIQHPKFRDAAILEHVLAARDRGVTVKFICGGTHGIEDRDLVATLSYQRILARAGVTLRRQRHLKLHAKLIIADQSRALLGSMNIDHDGFDIRRELGLAFDDADTIAALKRTFDADWDAAKKWEPADPLKLDLVTAIDAEVDPVPAIRHD